MNKPAIVACLLAAALTVHAQEPTYTARFMQLEIALQAARAALENCRKDGFQVAVAVVDRSGVVQVLLRDRYAGAHTTEMALDKAWTAVSFRTSTAALADATEAGKPLSGIRARPRVTAIAGGLMIEGAGALLGGIGVSGAPGGERDEACARAGIAAIQQQLDF
jgi:uncharacterized protein GlcG (DUF336 family)